LGEADVTGLTQLVNTGWSGLNAATQAMETISNNTANVNTPGYSVESVSQAEISGLGGGPGTGTNVTSIQRSFNQFVFEQLVAASSANQAAQVGQSNAQNLTAIFPVASGGAGGLGASLDSFFAAANTLTQNPTSVTDRQALIGNAQALAASFNSVGGQLSTNLANVNAQMTESVQQINSLTQQIARLNQAIIAQSAPGTTGPPNSLFDARDNLVQQLGQQLGVNVVSGPNNAIDIYTAGGAMLVGGTNSVNLVAGSGSYGDGNISITSQATGQDLTNSLSGGTLGGLVASRAQLESAQASVGGLAASLAAAVNTQQTLGIDLNGNLGEALFSVAAPSVHANADNTGSGALSAAIINTNAFTPGNFIVEKTAAGYEATNIATEQVTALGNGPSLSLDGMTLTVSGTINVGDSFELEPTATTAQTIRVAATDPSLIAAGSPYVVTPGGNAGNVAATTGSPAASGSLPVGTVIVSSTYFGQKLSVQFTSATSFNVVSSSNTVIASGSFSAANGAEIAVAYPSPAPAGEVATIDLSPGTPAIGDSFALTPGVIGSNGNMTAIAGLASQNLLSGQTLSGAYATLVGTIGNYAQSAGVAATATQGVLNQAQSAQQSISGVNLDEEAANLVNYQQAYQAAATVIGTAQTLFQSLLTAVQAG
jgi:flagellar hook-associated protein 1 FlgK